MKIAIIGAGIAGLSASHELTRLGHDVVIYEATDRAGGRGRVMRRPNTDDYADVGSQYFVASYSNILRIIDELGLTPKMRKVEGKMRFFTGSGPGETFVFDSKKPWFKSGGILDNVHFLLYAAKLILTNKSEKYAPSPRRTKFDNIPAIESTKSKFIRDNLLRMSTRTGLLNDLEDSGVHLTHVQHQLSSFGTHPLVTLEGGTASLHAELAKRANIQYNQSVKSLREEEGRVVGLTLESGEAVYADHVVVAANAVHAARLVPQGWTFERNYLAAIEQPPTIIVSLFLSDALSEDILTYYLPFHADTDVSYCTDANQKGTGNAPSGKTTLQAWIINPKSAQLMGKTDAELAQIARRDIAPYLSHVDNLIEGYAITRHQHTVPQFRVGHNERTHDFLDAIDNRPGVSFCGDYISNGNMESAVWSVERVVQQLGSFQRKAA